MANVKTLMLKAPGTNCDVETTFAFEQAGAQVESAHINELLRRQKLLSNYQILVIPGGFTYGDDISAGKILANEVRLKLGDDIHRFVEDGGLVLGICNGFQVLVKAGILSSSTEEGPPPLSLAGNDSGRFESRWVYLRVNQASTCIFTQGITAMYLPVAHGEGKLVAEPGILDDINVVLQYADETGNTEAGYPYNPNGSANSIAGICDDSGRIFAMMPHPERFIRWTQHPRWTREPKREYGDGFRVFQNAVQWVRSA